VRRPKLLLDRKKIRRWAKWVYLALAIIFGLGFLLIGVGNGSGSFNLFDISCSDSTTASTEVSNSELQTLLDSLATDATNTDTMLKIAAYYQELFRASEKTNTEMANNAIEYLNKAIDTDPTLAAVYLNLGKLYIDISSFTEAASILNQATSVDPNNPDVYLYLGSAQKSAGNTGAAILAWEKYLELTPADSRQAGAIRAQLQEMTAPSTTTTVAGATTTTVAASSTTTTTK
jgi:predicted Zn-dependent protease